MVKSLLILIIELDTIKFTLKNPGTSGSTAMRRSFTHQCEAPTENQDDFMGKYEDLSPGTRMARLEGIIKC
jgi:hypothetical protein